MGFNYCILYISKNNLMSKYENYASYSNENVYYFRNKNLIKKIEKILLNNNLNKELLEINNIKENDLIKYDYYYKLDIEQLEDDYFREYYNNDINILKNKINNCENLEQIKDEIHSFELNISSYNYSLNKIYHEYYKTKADMILILIS